MAALTPSQTIGPFFHEALRWNVGNDRTPPGCVLIRGRVLDVEGKAVGDALLEISFDTRLTPGTAFQRVFTDDQGLFAFHLPPGQVAHITVFARGLLRHLFTRVYLDASQVPGAVPAARRATLVAVKDGEDFLWNVRLRGDGETVFFDLG